MQPVGTWRPSKQSWFPRVGGRSQRWCGLPWTGHELSPRGDCCRLSSKTGVSPMARFIGTDLVFARRAVTRRYTKAPRIANTEGAVEIGAAHAGQTTRAGRGPRRLGQYLAGTRRGIAELATNERFVMAERIARLATTGIVKRNWLPGRFGTRGGLSKPRGETVEGPRWLTSGVHKIAQVPISRVCARPAASRTRPGRRRKSTHA